MTLASTDILDQLRGMNTTLLTPMARRATGRDSLEVDGYDAQPLTDIDPMTNPTNGGIYRVAGTAMDRDVPVPWSLVVKVLKSPAGMVMPGGHVITAEIAGNPALFNYWKRESLGFESGALHDLPDGLRAPRYFGSMEQPEEVVWLWLEEIVDTSTARWTLDRYGTVARQLGRFNGAYLAGRPLPGGEWLSQGWLRSWVTQVVAMIVGYMREPGPWEHPLVQNAFPRPVRERLFDVWNDHEVLLGRLERLPRTFCHLDAYRSNLMIRRGTDGRDETVAVDWAFTGIAALGEELAPLVVASMLLAHVPVAEAARLEEITFDAYLAGLSDAGWTGDPRLVRYGYTAAAALRYGFLSAADILRATFDAGQAAVAERQQRRPFTEILADRAELTYFLLDRADEARGLAHVL